MKDRRPGCTGEFPRARRRCCGVSARIAVEVRKPEELAGLDGLVIPGGESTTFMRLMHLYGLEEAVRRFERAILGTCAGMIVLDGSTSAWSTSRSSGTPRGDRCKLRSGIDITVRTCRCGAFSSALHGSRRGRWRRDARRARRASQCSPAGTLAGRCFPSRAHGRHACPRNVPQIRSGRRPCPVIASGRRSSGKKGATDKKRGQLFSKLVRAIIVAAREGGA